MPNRAKMKHMVKDKNSLTMEEVKHVAKLAKLNLSEKELTKFQKQLSDVIDYINKLREVNTDEVEPTSQVTNLENVFREDEVKPSLTQKEVLSNTNSSHDGFFKVKAVFEE